MIRKRVLVRLFILLISLCITFPLLAQESALPQNYMMEKYGVSQPFYCDLEDPIEEIACISWDSALGAIHHLKENNINFQESGSSFALFYALNAANLIQQQVSYNNQILYQEKLGFTNNISDSKLCLIRNHGRCGNHQLIFDEVMSFAGILSRNVGIYMQNNGQRFNHAANEVYVDNNWIFIDTTNGAIWRDIEGTLGFLSLEEVLSLPEDQKIKLINQNDLWTMVNFLLIENGVQNVNQYDYAASSIQILGVITDGEGIITFSPNTDMGFKRIPKYVGTNDGTNTGITMRWNVLEYGQNLDLKLDVAGVGGCSSNGPILLDDYGKEYPLEKGSNQMTVPNGGSFNVKRGLDEICYVVFDDITLLN
jgi:hypothetical protein